MADDLDVMRNGPNLHTAYDELEVDGEEESHISN